MSWEGENYRSRRLLKRCIPCGDMSWELPRMYRLPRSLLMHSVRRHELGVLVGHDG